MRNYFTFGNIDSRDFGVYISGEGVFNAPARSYQAISIPGRNGDLLIGGDRFDNIDITYPAFICSDFSANIRDFRNALASQKGYQPLIDSYHSSEVRYGCFMSAFEVEPTARLDAGEFEITFNCKPQRYNQSSLEPIESTASSTYFENTTSFDALPIITVYGYGILYEFLPDQTRLKWTIANIHDHVTFDSETMDIYSDSANANDAVTFETLDTPFPVFKPGTSEIRMHSQSHFTKIEVAMRTFEI